MDPQSNLDDSRSSRRLLSSGLCRRIGLVGLTVLDLKPRVSQGLRRLDVGCLWQVEELNALRIQARWLGTKMPVGAVLHKGHYVFLFL